MALIKAELASQSSTGKPAVVNMEDWAARVSLDIISQAGFGVSFDALTQPRNQLNRWYTAAFIVDEKTRPWLMLSTMTHPKFTNLLPIQRVQNKLQGNKEVRKWVLESITERRKTSSGVGDQDLFERKGQKDIISAVMKIQTLNTQGLVEQSLTLLGAGHGEFSFPLFWTRYICFIYCVPVLI